MTVAKCYTHSRQTFVIRIHCLFASGNRVRDVALYAFHRSFGEMVRFPIPQNNASQKQALEGEVFPLKSVNPVRTNQLTPIITQL